MASAAGMRCTRLLLCLLVTLGQLSGSLCFECSDRCKCIWRNGKMTAECMLQGLSSLPTGIDERLQVLNLTHNLIQALPKRAFSTVGLVNIQKLYLSRCELSHIDDTALFKVTNLIELDLAENKLSAVPTAALSHARNLRNLILSGNPITLLADMSFAELSELSALEMSGCRIETVSVRAFEGLTKLRVLKLDFNMLQTLPGRAMAPFQALHGVALDGNEWRCDCELRAFWSWLDRNNVSLYSPTCHKPTRLNGKPWKSLSPADMACPPTFLNTSTGTPDSIVVQELNNVTLDCRVRADPLAELSWLWKEKPVANRTEDSTPGQPTFLVTQKDAGDHERLSWLTLSFVQEPSAGTYACVAQNAAGRLVRNFTLAVNRRPTEVRASAGGTAEVEMTERVRESTELQQRPYNENPVLGMVIGILVGALAVLMVFGIALWLCRRRGRRRGPQGVRKAKRSEASSNHKSLHSNKQQQQNSSSDAAEVKLLVNPIQKPPRLLMTNSYQGLPSELEPLDPIGLCVESSSGVWVVKDQDYSTDESVLSSVPSRTGTIDRRSLARSPIPVPMPIVPADDLHLRLHGELTDTLRRVKGDRRPIVERPDGPAMDGPLYGGLETLRVRDLEARGPDLIDQIGAATGQKPSPSPPSQRWNPYDHPSAYYRTAGTPQGYPPSIPEAPTDGTEV